MRRKWRDLPGAVGMLLPSAVILGAFVVYPLVRAVQLGHLRCDATGRRCREGGWGQYIDVFRSNEFQHALANTVRLALMTVPGYIAALQRFGQHSLHPDNRGLRGERIKTVADDNNFRH